MHVKTFEVGCHNKKYANYILALDIYVYYVWLKDGYYCELGTRESRAFNREPVSQLDSTLRSVLTASSHNDEPSCDVHVQIHGTGNEGHRAPRKPNYFHMQIHK